MCSAAQNVMRLASVMSAAQVMCASRVMRNTSHHFAAKPQHHLCHRKTENRPLSYTISKDVIPPNRQTGGINGGMAAMLLELLKAKPNSTQKELAENLTVSLRTLQRTIKELKDAGILVRVGGNKSGHWEIKDK